MGMMQETREYFESVAMPELRREFPQLVDRLACGLVGNGSECYGFDDWQSLDHDCGVDFCIWTAAGDEGQIDRLRDWKHRLFEVQPPRFRAVTSVFGSPREPESVEDYFRNLIGTGGVPTDLAQWVAVPEENLSLATNGEVFFDGAGEFSAMREGLLGYLPEDLRRKRIAAWCMRAGQAGQYNLERMWRREDIVAVHLCKARFAEAVIALGFALARIYRPYYKWAHRMLCCMPGLGAALGQDLEEYMGMDMCSVRSLCRHLDLAERMGVRIAEELRSQGLSDSNDTFLVAHGLKVQESIVDERLARLPAQVLV